MKLADANLFTSRLGKTIRSASLPVTFVAVMLASALSPMATGAADWPHWRGADFTGVTSESGLADAWPDGGPPTVWRVDGLGEGFSSVAIVGNDLYTQGTADGKSIVFAIDLRTGRKLWSRELGSRLIQDRGNGPRGTPTVVAEHLYVTTGKGLLAKLAREDGRVVWSVDVLERYGATNPYWGFSESPLVIADRIYVMPGGSKATVVALQAADGSEIWTGNYGQAASYSSMVPATIDGVETLVGFTQAAGIGVRRSDGKLLWEYAAPANRTANATTPLVSGNIVVYSSAYGTGAGAIRVAIDGDKATTKELWFESKLQNHHGGIALYKGHLYGFFGNALGCAKLETGEILWQARSVGKGSLTIADDKLYLLGEKHSVGLAMATPAGYREGGSFDLERIREPAWAYPVVSDGRLYIRDQDTLTAYDVRAR